ncbi:SIMPL domain-containing protein [Nocardia sp. NBC_00416]|uniref:SIMPL domain-containing protein n=1 Tax=Nocardia sp. NBC_00416 TaxID=2975991 RepID=UPI002E1CF54D|nr:SIMPL domain-containing protein [Nocardia sp. NBC_00416]
MSQPQAGTVTVFGYGTVRATPDLLVLSIGIESRASTVGLAYDRAGRGVTAVTAALRADGVPDSDITTGILSVRSDTTWQDGSSRVTGYIATSTLGVTLVHRGPGGSGEARVTPSEIVAHAVAAGGDDARLGGLHHTFADRERLLTRARDAAWDNALDKARQYARRAARELGPVLEITEHTAAPPPAGPAAPGGVRLVAAAGPAPIPVEPGETELAATVRATWQLG